ncbi:hypothetical protein [Acinetobacter tjernbergiae]|uniref:Lipoprotein n=1 Tax=Acinetobacter tjernbergiae DSM 14971 = CIP 107465 TaxID=1120928 RepID=V2V4Q5_9GAMM|nr:hypothetical protein [Acinetobacter tjernbergiae]ESK55875.1 hypothetical protein F990_01529 [Acinetobacter tjernbergiae DSM 14971 = CIP 107465]
MLKILTILSLTSMLLGCTGPLKKYPSFTTQNTISISSEEVNKVRYGRVIDKSIPNAQILIGQSPLQTNSGVVIGGPLDGLIIAEFFSNISRTNNKTNNQLDFLKTLKFSSTVEEKIRQQFSEKDIPLKVIDSQNADMKIIPFVFISSSTNDFFLDFTLTTEIKNKVKFYRYRDRSFTEMKNINKEKFLKISDNAFNQLIDIFILDLNNHLDIKKLDTALQSKCEKISGKSWGKVGTFNKVSFHFIHNDQDRCIATLKDSVGIEYPQVYIFNEGKL